MTRTAVLAELFEAVLAEEPDLPALVQDGRTTSFGDWWARSAAASCALAELGVGRGDIVLLLLPSGRDFAVCYLAAMRLGAVVSAANPRLGPTEIGHIIARSAPSAIITDTPARIPAGVGYRVRTADELRIQGATAALAPPWTAVPEDDPAVIVWTSGSTGLPKGAWFDHRTLAFIAAQVGPLSAWHDRKLMPIPFAHTAYMTRVHDQLRHRVALVLTPPVWTAEGMLDMLTEQRVTVGQGVPTQWEKLIALDRLAEADLSSLRLVSTGASRVPAALVTELRERLGCAVVVRYASTEVPLAFGTRIGDPPATVAHTVGRPLGGAEVEIRTVAGERAATGQTGRIHLRSRAAMRGYWQDPDQTARTIAADGWLTTGDLGHLDAEGNLTIVGRADDVYIRGGYNVHPAEVEAALSAHPGVARVAVVGTPAPVIGEIGVAFVVARGDGARGGLSATQLQTWCRERIADYKTPDAVVFVEDLPVNATYKIDTTRLRELAVAATVRSSMPRPTQRIEHGTDRLRP
jgi:acyl-CoA synthetase (AMP-forming)/AMP-acid ligase II